jgi:hypothetical protein
LRWRDAPSGYNKTVSELARKACKLMTDATHHGGGSGCDLGRGDFCRQLVLGRRGFRITSTMSSSGKCRRMRNSQTSASSISDRLICNRFGV